MVMFKFFKKKEKPKKYGTFGAYGMEDLYDFLTEEKILNKAMELKDQPTLGTSFDDFLNKEVVKSPSGEFYFFLWLLWIFPNDLKLTLELFRRRSLYSENDYPKKESLKKFWEDHVETMNIMLEREPDNQYYKSYKRNIYWIEYSLFYTEILKNLTNFFNTKIFSDLNITGIHRRKGTKIQAETFEATIRARRNYTGFILTFKSPELIDPIKVIIDSENRESFFFNWFSKTYKVAMSKETATIALHKIEGVEDSLLNNTDFIKIIEDLVREYLNNFDSISKRFENDHLKDPINVFFKYALEIPQLNHKIRSQIIHAI